MHTTQLSLARPCTTNHHASKRRAAVWSPLLSVLILTAAVVAPAAAAPPGASPKPTPTPLISCEQLGAYVYNAYKEAGASDEKASEEALRATGRCLDGRKKKL